ncbi:MAG: anaerobic ribonucleoside-triphosphate reductase activating protein [Clostridia bacterium]|nr:anaerobic ribonucleoside-triphosphate reductase activating protein [Clostridia bacterium]
MNFSGFQKLTLLDYPGHVACTLFTKGCNFRCPFCHNALLVTEQQEGETYSDETVLSYLKKRVGILDGVCITGGEPLLQKELPDFIRKVKELGFLVKLDTNGSFPDRLKALACEGLIDYVAMDVKNSMERYGETVDLQNFSTEAVEESIDFLLEGNVPYEFRTTVVAEFHTPQDIVAIAKRIQGAEKYFLQNFVDSGCLIGENLHSVGENVMKEMQNAALEHLSAVSLRGL